MDLTVFQVAIACAIVLIASAVQGAVGFGFALVCVPALVMIDPRLVPGVILPLTLLQTLMMAWRERGDIDRNGLGWSLSGRFAGAGIGAAVLLLIPSGSLTLVFGILVLLAVCMSVIHGHLNRKPATLVGAGMMSGIMGTISSMGGPPIVLVYQNSTGPQVRSTLGVYFCIGAIQSMIALLIIGRLGPREMAVAAALVPALLIGQRISLFMTGHLDRGHTRKALLTVAGVAGVALIVRGALGG